MFESEDGTLTGSINVSQLKAVKPKTDEAKAQLEALKRDLGLDDAHEAEPEAADEAREDKPEAEDLDALRAEAEAAGVKVDGRWGGERLQEEIAAAAASASKGKGKN